MKPFSEEQERNRIKILTALDEAGANLAAGEYDDYTDETLPMLSQQLKSEARTLRDRNPK